MAYPIWLTPAGNLGIVPESEYYQFALDAYDTSGGTLRFFKLSGDLPPGLQITSTGVIQGIPISTAGPDLNQTYEFTVRLQNQSTLLIADRSFSITITNVAPPIIIPRDVDLGQYFDGQVVNLQLVATEFILGGNLIWSLKSGELPSGLSISPSGLISGYINLIPAVGPESDPGWDDTDWDGQFTFDDTQDQLGWDFPLGTVAKNFEFTVEVSDGMLTDTSTYKMYVVPKKATTADSTFLTADVTIVNNVKFTVDTGSRHNPIIVSTQDNVPPEREGSWITIKFEAFDFDEDVLKYSVPTLSAGTFDEQTIVGQPAYLGRSFVDNGNINVGINETGGTIQQLTSGDELQVLVQYTDFVSSQTTYLWHDAVVNDYAAIRITGNTIITGNAGDIISQEITSANATVISISETTGNIRLAGGLIIGTIDIGGNLITSANVGDIITQNASTGNAVVLANISLTSRLPVRFYDNFVIGGGNLKLNGSNISSFPTAITSSIQSPFVEAALGDIITQPTTGATATIIKSQNSFGANLVGPLLFEVEFNAGEFATGPTSGNIQVNGNLVELYPEEVYMQADINFEYNTNNTFRINQEDENGFVIIDGRNSFAQPTAFLSVGVDVEPIENTQGSIGFDEGKFDQGALSLPGTLQLDPDSGWLTGYLPSQISDRIVYDFELVVYKRDYPEYQASRLFQIIALGDLYNTVEWLTPEYLGTIQNGEISDLSIRAINSQGKPVYYYYTPRTYINMVQGLKLQSDGLISGRVSFELFGLDGGSTIFDLDIISNNPTTTFDHTFEFTVTAETYDQSASSTRTFRILVQERNVRPYENLYLKAILTDLQKIELRNILQNTNILPTDMIYRNSDPWYGIAKDITTLFLPGLTPSTLAQYADAIKTNHFTKRILFSDIKTAIARYDGIYDVFENATQQKIGTYNVYTRTFVPNDFSLGYKVRVGIPPDTVVGDQTIKYEVIYAEIKDLNSNEQGQGPDDAIDLSNKIINPYTINGNVYYTATPNSFENMTNVLINNIGYQDKGILPDWMTSIQPNDQQLGFVRAVVLAYTVPGASETVAWRLKQQNYNFNEINFVVDQYQLDNIYSQNYDLSAGTFITSSETTFDRYPALPFTFRPIGSVDYAINRAFQEINERAVSEIINDGGLDGITRFQDGETLVFFEQEYPTGIDISDQYNQGWAISIDPWDDPNAWDYPYPWDPAGYVPGYREWLASRQVIGTTQYYSSINYRIGVWKINIDQANFVRLTPANLSPVVTSISPNDAGFGSNLTVSSSQGLFVGMPVRGTGLSNISVITNINGSTITVYPDVPKTSTDSITFIPIPLFNDAVYVRKGRSRGGVNIYYDPIVKTDNLVPNWSEIPQQVRTVGTTFDGDGTKFYDYRDSYATPYQEQQMVKFPRRNVFV